jgi:hypothetical protein
MLKIKGHNIFIIQKVSLGSFENHNLKSAKAKIRNMIVGRIIIENKTINLLTKTPFICFDILDSLT